MLTRLGSALQAAADVIAPPCARVEDLRYHWSQVVGACRRHQGPNSFSDTLEVISTASEASARYSDVEGLTDEVSIAGDCNGSATAESSMPATAAYVPAVEETHAPRHLSNMLRILVEEKHDSGGALSPCLEFLVTEKVLKCLAAFAWVDRPLGIRQHAFVFMSGVLQHLHHTHLHHTCIHRPFQKMVLASCSMTASPYEAEEIDFLAALCEKIRQDNSLVLLYIQKMVLASCSMTASPYEAEEIDFLAALCEKIRQDNSLVLLYIQPVLTTREGACSVSRSNSVEPSPARTPSLPHPSRLISSSVKSGPTSDLSSKTSSTQELDVGCSLSQPLSANSGNPSASPANPITSTPTAGCGGSSTENESSHTVPQSHSSEEVPSCSRSSRRSSLSSYSVVSSVGGSSSAWTLTTGGRFSNFPLVDALLNLCSSSADGSISATAHECLLQLCSVREASCCKVLAHHSLLPHYIASRLAHAVSEVPKALDPILLEDFVMPQERSIAAAAVESDESDVNSEEENFTGRKELINMFQWLAFLDKAVISGDRELRGSLCSCVTHSALDGELRPRLISSCEEIRSTLALLTRFLHALSSHALVMCVVRWMCGAATAADSVLPLLLRHCALPPHQVQTLRLLQTALQRSRGGAASLLLSPWLLRRRYVDAELALQQQQCWSDEEDERAKKGSETSPTSSSVSRTFAPTNIDRIVKEFVSLVPEELRSSGTDDFASYCADAGRQCRDSARGAAALHHWGREAGAPQDLDVTGERPESPSVGPGLFLDTLLDLLEKLPSQDYDVNLQVTSVVANLALLPHPQLHEYLLNPLLPLAAGVRTLHGVLRTVARTLAASISAVPHYLQQLHLARHQLLGGADSWQFLRDDQTRQFEAMIVLEEFCKELAAIAHAKYTIEMNR
ncbi:Retinoic acid induced 16-like protein [Trinorchestia longiramus]|nr:Retinoic acid induced 16-like protein [Trinorchestia longiramus]